MPPADFTATETRAIDNARTLMRSCAATDNISNEIFELALKNFNDVTKIAVDARSARTKANRPLIKKLLKK